MGANRFRIDMPLYMGFYRLGRLHLDKIISELIKLQDINEAFDDLRVGYMARSVIMFS